MPDREKTIKEALKRMPIEGLEWILEDDRFGFGVNWSENDLPECEEEWAGYYIQRAIDALKLLKVDNIRCINFAYERGFKFGYLAAKLGVNWPNIPEDERKVCEDEAKEALKLWTGNCEKGR